MAAINQGTFPGTIVVILGTAWDGNLGLSENDMVTLTKVSSSPGQVIYTEDGTDTPNQSTNRIKVFMRAFGSATTFAPGCSMVGEFANTMTSWSYVTQLPGTTVSFNNLYYQVTGPPYNYTFRKIWATNTAYTDQSTITTSNDGWPKVFKSMVEGTPEGTFQYSGSGGLITGGTASIVASDFAFIASGEGGAITGSAAIVSSTCDSSVLLTLSMFHRNSRQNCKEN